MRVIRIVINAVCVGFNPDITPLLWVERDLTFRITDKTDKRGRFMQFNRLRLGPWTRRLHGAGYLITNAKRVTSHITKVNSLNPKQTRNFAAHVLQRFLILEMHPLLAGLIV